jgi:hypothetical protein
MALLTECTFENPHQYSVGVRDVLVNGMQVLKNGEHTGVKPGRALLGPGKIGGNWNSRKTFSRGLTRIDADQSR